MSRVGSKRSMREEDAEQKAEKPERNRKVGGGTAEDTTSARQALTARGDKANDEASLLIEKVLRRENMMKAHKRVVANGGAPCCRWKRLSRPGVGWPMYDESMVPNARFWAHYFRRVYVRAIQGFRAGALEKAAPAFNGIAEEADAANLANVSRRKERPEPGTA